ncbi:MAG: hypothetical protein RMM08_12355 [Armatimonadota bacterium]|nr:hypothetical protein [bacterium]MDW8322142.1 hypothetical protein [Armatimonadota bacterium]
MMIFVCLLLATVAQSAPKEELLGQPCRSKNVLAARYVAAPGGKEWFVLTNMNETAGMELIFIDFRNNTGRAIRAPAGAGSWALLQVAGNRLIVGTFYDGKFMVFDLQRMEFVKAVDFPGESYIWNLAVGSDGRVYGGTYRGAKLGALDLNTYTVEDCGAPAPPNMYLRYVSALPDGRILCNFGMEKPVNLIYDPRTQKFEEAPPTLQGIERGVAWNGYFLAGSRVLDGNTLQPVEPPFPLPSGKGGWTVDVNLTTEEALYLWQGNAVYRYAKGDKELRLLASVDLRGGSIYAVTEKGELLGVRGQDYFVIQPGESQVTLKPIPVEPAPRPTFFLRLDDKGRLWGGPSFGQTLFWMDTRTGHTVNTRTVCNSGGEVYDVTFHQGKVYAVAYAGGDIIRYDPEAPWDQWNNINPRVIASLGEKGYIRPTAGVVLGTDGKLYSGWMANYGVYGGAVAVTDPATGETNLIENPLGEQAVEGLAVDERFIYVGTSLGANGLPNKKGEWARFGVVDKATKQTVFRHEFDGASGVRSFWLDKRTKRLAFSVDGRLRLFDTAAQRFIEPPAETPRVGSRIIGLGDGKAYYGSGKTIVQIDLSNGRTQVVAELAAGVSSVAIEQNGTLYAACGADIYRVRRQP